MLKFAALILVASFTALASTVAASDASRIDFLTASTANRLNPHDIKLSPGGKYMFVSDVDNDWVAVLDAETLQLVDYFGSDHQGDTHYVDFDTAVRIYLADTHNGRVTIYEMSGTRGRLVSELTECIRGPEGVEVRGETLWIFDSGNDRIVKYRLRRS
mgnify:CR=1 FL=1